MAPAVKYTSPRPVSACLLHIVPLAGGHGRTIIHICRPQARTRQTPRFTGMVSRWFRAATSHPAPDLVARPDQAQRRNAADDNRTGLPETPDAPCGASGASLLNDTLKTEALVQRKRRKMSLALTGKSAAGKTGILEIVSGDFRLPSDSILYKTGYFVKVFWLIFDRGCDFVFF